MYLAGKRSSSTAKELNFYVSIKTKIIRTYGRVLLGNVPQNKKFYITQNILDS